MLGKFSDILDQLSRKNHEDEQVVATYFSIFSSYCLYMWFCKPSHILALPDLVGWYGSKGFLLYIYIVAAPKTIHVGVH